MFKKLYVPFFLIVFVLYLLLIYIFYKYRRAYEFTFESPFGYIFLLFLIGFTYYLNKNLGIITGFLIGLMYLLSRFLQPIHEGFQSQTEPQTKWSQQTQDDFAKYQATFNPNLIFDLNNIQQQATEDEVKDYMKNNKWTWEDITQKTYMDQVQSNTVIKTSPEDAMNSAQKIYNNSIMKEMISWLAPEGQALLSGIMIDSSANHAGDSGQGTYGVKSGLVSENKDIIKCGLNKDGELVPQLTKNLGNDGIFGAHQKQVIDISFSELPKLIPQFSFVSGECNPCKAINSPADYSCPFSINKNKEISTIWRNLWGLDNSYPEKIKDEDNTSTNKKEFPILYELKRELDKIQQ